MPLRMRAPRKLPPSGLASADMDTELARILKSLTTQICNDSQIVSMEEIRGSAGTLAGVILEQCPSSRERSLALTHLEEVVMWACKSVALNNAE